MFDLKGFRRYCDMSQKDIAATLEVTQASVSAVELGKAPVPYAWVRTLRAKYGIEVENFVTKPTSTEDVVVPRPVWEVLQSQAATMSKQADSLEKRDQYMKDLVEMLKAVR